jgi:hypothetical protein
MSDTLLAQAQCCTEVGMRVAILVRTLMDIGDSAVVSDLSACTPAGLSVQADEDTHGPHSVCSASGASGAGCGPPPEACCPRRGVNSPSGPPAMSPMGLNCFRRQGSKERVKISAGSAGWAGMHCSFQPRLASDVKPCSPCNRLMMPP